MKLLMITRKVDRHEHLAGFIYNWVKKIGEQVEELRVISWQQGDSSGLPGNIKVFSLKTEQNKIIKMINFWRLVKKNIKEVDGVFCHQMPIYTILAAPLAKLYRKKIISWYMHRQINLAVRLMEKLTDNVLSASKESFRLPSKKLIVTGHGIDVDLFKPVARKENKTFQILSVGRISPTKDYESMIKAMDILNKKGINNIELTIIGQAGLAGHGIYFNNLQQMIEKMGLAEKIKFIGSRPNWQIPRYLQSSDLFINMSGTGSIDKAVLEAMACECLVLTANSAFAAILPAIFMSEPNQPEKLAEKIIGIISLAEVDKNKFRSQFREEVVKNHNLDNLVKKIIKQYV
ncbi:MAG: glycosyltransferase family 4 protein [Candidatus Buchananbacteria bacterium]